MKIPHSSWLAVFLSGIAAAAPPPFPAPRVPGGLGVNIHFTEAMPGELEMIADAGLRWVRMDFFWQDTEREKGVYDFSRYVGLMDALEKRGLRALFILDYSNTLHEPVGTAAGRAAFARWAAAAVSRFKDRGIVWEIWNEPNIGFWKPRPDAGEYCALALETCRAIRAVAPDELIVAPATSEIDLSFLEACFERGLLEWIDAVSVHPYRQTGPEGAAREYAILRRLIERHAPHGKAIPILSGEWGYSAAWPGCDEARQAELLARQWLTNLASGIPISIWYDWRNDGKDPKEPEHHFGTVRHEYRPGADPPFEPKPAYHSARTLTRTLDGMRFVKRLALGGRDDHVLLFADGDRQALACWTTSDEPHSLTLPTAAEPAALTSHLGEPVPITETIHLTFAPHYISLTAPDAALMASPAFPRVTWQAIRTPGKRLIVSSINEGSQDFDGAIRVTAGEASTRRPVTLSGPDATNDAEFPLTESDDQPVSVTVELMTDGRRLLDPETVTLRLARKDLLENSVIRGDGDPKVGSEHHLSVTAGKPPGFTAPVWKIDYRFDAGWRFITVGPPGGQPIDGNPRAFGLWVHGDGGGCGIRMRVRDANGRTWQLSGPRIDWRGWRHVELPLNAETAHWGGEGAPIPRAPLIWDAVFLLDNISRKPCAGSVMVAAPVLVE
jgi:hypothetical protein